MPVSDRDLQAARRIAAEVVHFMGEQYWPLFEMVDEEWARRQQRSARITECLSGDTTEETRSNQRARHRRKHNN